MLNSRILSFLFGSLTLLAYMNCTKQKFDASSTDLSALALSNQTLSPVTTTTKKNKTVTFNAGSVNGRTVGTLSFNPAPGATLMITKHGRFAIVNAVDFVMVYTPNESFVGTDTVPVFATDVYGNALSGQVTVIVGNLFNGIKPALAVRGISCITCHSNVSSNVITDYGYGNPWYFDTKSLDSFYFDRLNDSNGVNGLATLNLLSNSKIFVPAARVPAAIESQMNVTSLAEFVQARFAQGSTNTSSQVVEVPSLKINIPTVARIKELFGNPVVSQLFIPDTQNSPDLDGLKYDDVNKVFTISNLTCDGDLYLDGSVAFTNAVIKSVSGCRIYTTGVVFIDIPIQSVGYKGSPDANTQILAADSIWMGTGRINNNGLFCELDQSNKPTGWYTQTAATGVDCTDPANAANPNCDTFNMRSSIMIQRSTFSVQFPDLTSLNGLMAALPAVSTQSQARLAVEASLGQFLLDASCQLGKRNNSISKLMLVAPYVNNRYSGDFSGSTIAEAALMSLGKFTYQFDPVFARVSILSMLDEDELISGQGI